jgi:glycosyltransferase involved in cell wall biosynthesis
MNSASVQVTIPVYNEQARLPVCLEKLIPFLHRQSGWDWELMIADNGSTDRTVPLALAAARMCDRVRVRTLEQKGRGGALKKVWLESKAGVLAYMDVDLSTDLEHLPALVGAIAEEGYDLAIGSRLAPESSVTRSATRELTSRGYNLLLNALLGARFSDAQCGFKAISKDAAQALLPRVLDSGWFFDTELLVLAQAGHYSIREIPVRWVENADSRVKLLGTILADVVGMLRLRHALAGKKA